MTAPGSAFEQVLEAVRAGLHARKADLARRVEQVERALEAYEAAVEDELALHYAAEHGLKRPRPRGAPPQVAAEALLAAVMNLPELASPPSVAPASLPPETAPPESLAEPEPAEVEAVSTLWPRLLARARRAPLVVVGGVSKRERGLEVPVALKAHLEWIDTTRQGTHAIGNLERRIRAGRLTGLVVLEGMISHRHSDPLISAARQVGLPCAYAGRGGRAALTRALDELEAALGRGDASE